MAPWRLPDNRWSPKKLQKQRSDPFPTKLHERLSVWCFDGFFWGFFEWGRDHLGIFFWLFGVTGFKGTKCMNSRFWFDKLRSWWIFARKHRAGSCSSSPLRFQWIFGRLQQNMFSPQILDHLSWALQQSLFSKRHLFLKLPVHFPKGNNRKTAVN